MISSMRLSASEKERAGGTRKKERGHASTKQSITPEVARRDRGGGKGESVPGGKGTKKSPEAGGLGPVVQERGKKKAAANKKKKWQRKWRAGTDRRVLEHRTCGYLNDSSSQRATISKITTRREK